MDLGLSSRRILAVITVTAGTLAWFFLLDTALVQMLQKSMGSVFLGFLGEAVVYASAVFSAIVGSFISDRVNRRNLLWFWITFGVFSTIFLGLIQGVALSFTACIMVGVSLGLGFPASTAFLADNTDIDQRGRVSGMIIIETFIMVVLGVAVASIFSLSFLSIVILSVLLRATSYLSLFLDPCARPIKEKNISWQGVLTNKNFIVYIVPWVMFNVAAGLASFVLIGLTQSPNYLAAVNLAEPFRYLGAAVFGLIGGLMADRIGRKQPIIIALVILGVSFAFLGIAPSFLTIFVYRTISGVAWGMLMVVYLAIPGDIAGFNSKEKYYALGWSLPIIIYLGLTDIQPAFNVEISPGILSPLLSIILFASIIPILYATETLSTRKMRERKLKEHIESIGKLIEESKKESENS